MDSVIDFALELLGLGQEVKQINKRSTSDEMRFEILKRFFDLALSPGMTGQRTRGLKAVVSTEMEIAFVPLEVCA